MQFGSIYGVDFSGAKRAGRTTWVARIEPASCVTASPSYTLTALSRLEDACGTP